jgi:hypothetical protein
MRSRRIATTAVAALVATGVVAGATTNPAAAAGPGPQPVTSWLDAVAAEERSWVSIYWTTGRKICDGAVTVTGDDVQIGYPENTVTYTSFSQSAKLKPRHLDYTAFTVRPRAGEDLFRQVEATLSYNTCGRQAVEKSETFRLTFAVLPATAAKR